MKKIIILAVAFIVLIIGAYALYSFLGEENAPDLLVTEPNAENNTPSGTSSGESEEITKHMAMDFTVYDTNGNEVKLSDYFGKPIVLNFWASWCGPCQSEMPDFNSKYLEIGNDVQFLMVNMTGGRETLEGAKSFIEESGYSFPVFYDVDMDAANIYQVYSLPTTYFIDAEGYLIAQATGAIDAATLERGIGMITN